MSVSGYWADLPTTAFADLAPDTIAVLPLGATEQHGPHLPLSVDSDLVTAVLERSLAALPARASVLVLPRLSITKSDEHDAFPGTLSLSAETLLAVLRDIGASVARAAITRLVLFNGHGGNTALLQIAARDLRLRHGMIAIQCSWSGFAEWQGHFDADAYADDIHAGDSETSAMRAVRPGLVDMEKARDFAPAMANWAKDFPQIGLTGKAAQPGWLVQDLNPHGAVGNAAAATAEKGEALIDSAARNFARFLEGFTDFDHRGTRE